MMNRFTMISESLSKKDKADTQYLYKDLAPVDDIDEKSEYFNALDWALSSNKINNIALSGPYGAGKSSVIDSYLKKNHLKSIRVSLADFAGTEEYTPEDIEKEFLKQLFYKVDYKRIPQSRYRKLHKISAKTIFCDICLLEVLVAMMAGVITPEKTKLIYQKVMEANSVWSISDGIWKLFIIATLVLFNFAVSKLLKLTFSKWKNWEISIADKAKVSSDSEKEESIFNRHLDEIVYFFEETKYEIVFVEDLDRFENVDIFVTLRELNQILNGYESIKKHITFVYAIRDDFFESSTQRTKFFDYIIPVIPYINSTNSGDLLRRRLEEIKSAGVNVELQDSYITQISPYISDMRVLTSIVNEFLLYKKTQIEDNDLGLRDEIMLSLMIFKNLYPKEFAELECERGIVKDALNCKKEFTRQKTDALQEEANEIHSVLEKFEQEHIKSLTEIKVSMLSAIADDYYVRNITINRTGESFSRDAILSEDFDLTRLSGNILNIQRVNLNGNTSSIQVQDINSFTQNGKTFIERWKVILEAEGEKQELLKNTFEEKQSEIYALKALKIKELIEKYSVVEIFEGNEHILQNQLLIFLLRNGYIDETYANYINYFHPDSITADEQGFILNIRNFGGAREFDETISHKSRVIERLLIHEFRQEEILNFDIVECIVGSQNEKDRCHELMQLLSLRTEKTKEFIKRYIQAREVSAGLFIKDLTQYNDYMWKDILDDETIPSTTKDHYFDLIISYSDIADLRRINRTAESTIAKYMCEYPDIFTRIKLASAEKLIECIDVLNIIFDDILLESADKKISDFVVQNRMYAINTTMFNRVVAYRNLEVAERFTNGNYTALLELEDPEILAYANDNIEAYLENVVVQDNNNHESLEAVLKLSNILGFEIEKVTDLLKCQQIEIDSLDQVFDYETEENKKDIKIYLDFCFENSMVKICWKNANLYNEKYGLSKALLEQIIKNISSLINEDEEQPEGTLFKSLLQEEWPNADYRLLVHKYKLEPYDIPVASIAEKQTEILIEEKVLPFNLEYATRLAELYPDLRLEYFIAGKGDLWNLITEMSLDIIPINEMIKNNNFTEDEKIYLLSLMDSTDVSMDMACFIKNCSKPMKKPYVIAAWDVLPEDERYELLVNHLSSFDNDELPELFMNFATVYHSLAQRTKHKVTLAKTSYNEKLLSRLKQKDYITSFSTELVPDESKAHLFTSEKKEVLVAWVKENQN